MGNIELPKVSLYHGEYTQLFSSGGIRQLVKTADENCISTIGIIDRNIMNEYHDFDHEVHRLREERSISHRFKQIYGAEMYFADNKDSEPFEEAPKYTVTLLVKNHDGFYHLHELMTLCGAGREGVLKKWLAELREGLLIGSFCSLEEGTVRGEIEKAIADGKTIKEMESLAKDYDFIEIQPASGAKNKEKNKRIVALGEELNIPVIATCSSTSLNVLGLFRKFRYLGEEKAYEIVVKNPNRIAEMIEKSTSLYYIMD